MTERRDRGRADGFATLQLVVASALGLLVLVVVANVLVDLYARGAVRHAVTEGVRAGTPVDAPAGACVARGRDALADLLAGPIGRDVDLRCDVSGDVVVATAEVTLASWLRGIVPDWSFTVRAEALRR